MCAACECGGRLTVGRREVRWSQPGLEGMQAQASDRSWLAARGAVVGCRPSIAVTVRL